VYPYAQAGSGEPSHAEPWGGRLPPGTLPFRVAEGLQEALRPCLGLMPLAPLEATEGNTEEELQLASGQGAVAEGGGTPGAAGGGGQQGPRRRLQRGVGGGWVERAVLQELVRKRRRVRQGRRRAAREAGGSRSAGRGAGGEERGGERVDAWQREALAQAALEAQAQAQAAAEKESTRAARRAAEKTIEHIVLLDKLQELRDIRHSKLRRGALGFLGRAMTLWSGCGQLLRRRMQGQTQGSEVQAPGQLHSKSSRQCQAPARRGRGEAPGSSCRRGS